MQRTLRQLGVSCLISATIFSLPIKNIDFLIPIFYHRQILLVGNVTLEYKNIFIDCIYDVNPRNNFIYYK